jgi:tetratricopeptide (TPR) repeat protein
VASKQSLNYLDKSKGYEELSPEFLFGDALYNYYRDWVPENYPSLKTILWLFPKGDKSLGIKQLQEVANNAFYTRTEAQYFLMRIYSDENQPIKAYQLCKYLHETFPDNSYFQRYYARLAFMQGRFEEVEQVSMDILDKLENRRLPGYEVTSGRYASYYLGYVYGNTYRDVEKAKLYYKRAVVYSEQAKAFDSGYYWGPWPPWAASTTARKTWTRPVSTTKCCWTGPNGSRTTTRKPSSTCRGTRKNAASGTGRRHLEMITGSPGPQPGSHDHLGKLSQ